VPANLSRCANLTEAAPVSAPAVLLLRPHRPRLIFAAIEARDAVGAERFRHVKVEGELAEQKVPHFGNVKGLGVTYYCDTEPNRDDQGFVQSGSVC
jgi:hypothetical protein